MTAKRALDLTLAVPAAIVAAPIIATLALLVVATSGWPPIIVQTRVGARERPIWIMKLRTMRLGTPTVAKSELMGPDRANGTQLYTFLGPLLRKLSLDELPQVFHVLTGEMSLVGPRPALPSQHDLIALRRRHQVTDLTPGLTGLAQIEGRESLSLATKVRFEAHYRRHMSLCFDLAIIGRTFGAILSRRGAL